MDQIQERNLCDADLRDTIHEEFETWDKNDFKGLSGRYAHLRTVLMAHGVYVPDHRILAGSMRKSITDAANGVKWTREKAGALSSYETVVTRNRELQEFLDKSQVPKHMWNRPDWKATRTPSPMPSPATADSELPDIGKLRISDSGPGQKRQSSAQYPAQPMTPVMAAPAPLASSPLGERQQMAVSNPAVMEQQGRASFGHEKGTDGAYPLQSQDARNFAPHAGSIMGSSALLAVLDLPPHGE